MRNPLAENSLTAIMQLYDNTVLWLQHGVQTESGVVADNLAIVHPEILCPFQCLHWECAALLCLQFALY